MSRLGSEEYFREGHRQGRYLFTAADAADGGIPQTIIPISSGFAFRMTGFYYWFRARTVGALTGMHYVLAVGVATVWSEELEVAGAVRNAGMVGPGDVFFPVGGNGDDVIFQWNPLGGLPVPGLRGGIIVWGYQERVA